jgi:hypothetical protein
VTEGPFPRGVALDTLRPRPEDTTILGRLRTKLGPVKADKIPGRDLQKIGAHAAARFRKLWNQEPPRVQEDHPELGGSIAVFCYPGETACKSLDEAIDAVFYYEYAYNAPSAPLESRLIFPATCKVCNAGLTMANTGWTDGKTASYCAVCYEKQTTAPVWTPGWLKPSLQPPPSPPPLSQSRAAEKLSDRESVVMDI